MTDKELDDHIEGLVNGVMAYLDANTATRDPDDAAADKMTALGGALGMLMYSITPDDPMKIAKGVAMMARNIVDVAMSLYESDEEGA